MNHGFGFHVERLADEAAGRFLATQIVFRGAVRPIRFFPSRRSFSERLFYESIVQFTCRLGPSRVLSNV